MPPTNAPKNCEVEYNPIAKPRLSSVAILDISEGKCILIHYINGNNLAGRYAHHETTKNLIGEAIWQVLTK
jgi:hypothetical protein